MLLLLFFQMFVEMVKEKTGLDNLDFATILRVADILYFQVSL